MYRKELSIDRRTLLEATTVVALSTAPGGATAGSGTGGAEPGTVTDDDWVFGYGGGPLRVTAETGAVPPPSDEGTPSEGRDNQGYGEHGYGGVVP